MEMYKALICCLDYDAECRNQGRLFPSAVGCAYARKQAFGFRSPIYINQKGASAPLSHEPGGSAPGGLGIAHYCINPCSAKAFAIR